MGSWMVLSLGFEVRLRFRVDLLMDDRVGFAAAVDVDVDVDVDDVRDASVTPKPETLRGLVGLKL